MPKRKHSDVDSATYIKKNIKKLERKLLRRQRRKSSSSSDSTALSNEPQDGIIIESEEVEGPIMVINQPGPTTSASALEEPLSFWLPEASTEFASQEVIEQEQPVKNDEHHTQELDEMVLEILGADPSVTAVFGKDIQKDLAVRFQFIGTSGLTKEFRKELLTAHLPPANCKLIDAPALNPEIKAAVTDNVIKRDKAIHAKQKQVCSAIACLSEAITLLLSKEDKDPIILKLLMDCGRILCDSQHSESITRRNFILAVLKKELKDQLLLTKIDNILFGQQLAYTLKSAKAINKSGAELKSVVTPVTSRTFANKPKPSTSSKNLNWKAPVPNRRLAGPKRAKESAPPARQQQTPSSRASRQNTNRGRR